MPNSYEMLSGVEKAALVIMQLEDEAIGKILKSMATDEITKISTAMSNIGSVSSDIAEMVMQEAYDRLSNNKNIIGNFNNTKEILKRILGEEEAEVVINNIDGNIWKKLSQLKPEKLAVYLHNENPQIIALVLDKLPQNITALVMTHLPQNLAIEVMLRLSTINPVNEQMINKVESTIQNDFDTLIAKDSAENIAQLLDYVDRKNKDSYLKALTSRDKMLTESIRNKMFAFEKIIELDDKGVQTLLKNIDKNILAVALKGADNTMQKLFFDNMSERAAKIIREDMEEQGPISMDEIETAQNDIARTAKELLAEGTVKRKITPNKKI